MDFLLFCRIFQEGRLEYIGKSDLNVNTISEKAGISRFTIHRRFNEKFGMSPKKYLDSVRLQKVLSLLRETNLPIAEIATAAGFANANYLAKFFRKKKMISPSEFRNVGHIP